MKYLFLFLPFFVSAQTPIQDILKDSSYRITTANQTAIDNPIWVTKQDTFDVEWIAYFRPNESGESNLVKVFDKKIVMSFEAEEYTSTLSIRMLSHIKNVQYFLDGELIDIFGYKMEDRVELFPQYQSYWR